MKPLLISINADKDQSVSIRHYNELRFQNSWHYHKELELVYVIKGEGTRFVGDNIEDFKTDDLVLLGANLPHRWKNEVAVGSGWQASELRSHRHPLSSPFSWKGFP